MIYGDECKGIDGVTVESMEIYDLFEKWMRILRFISMEINTKRTIVKFMGRYNRDLCLTIVIGTELLKMGSCC